jgi:hypothetical protein
MVEFKRVVNHMVLAHRFQHKGQVALLGNLLGCQKAWGIWAELALDQSQMLHLVTNQFFHK